MDAFLYSPLPARVIFGFGTIGRVGEEMARLGCKRALVLATPQQAESAKNLAARLQGMSAGVFARAAMHTPIEVTNQAMGFVRENTVDCLVGLGGGSTTGLGKAIALRTDLPQIVIPTTYAGSEATPILGETVDGKKTTQRSAKILPEVIIYDVDLTMTLPPLLTVTSGMNAIAHAVEALYAQDANPVTSLLAEEGIRSLSQALPAIIHRSNDREARSRALYGAWLCGTCLGAAGMALHHKICHVLGGSFDLPHAETHTIILPHVIAYNLPAARTVLTRAAQALGIGNAAQGLFELARQLNAPKTLRDIGMNENDLDKAADLAVSSQYWNPRAVVRDEIRQVLDDAFHGREPRSWS
jgi:maleylacetate reductase